jgi:hypothetical protein
MKQLTFDGVQPQPNDALMADKDPEEYEINVL